MPKGSRWRDTHSKDRGVKADERAREMRAKFPSAVTSVRQLACPKIKPSATLIHVILSRKEVLATNSFTTGRMTAKTVVVVLAAAKHMLRCGSPSGASAYVGEGHFSIIACDASLTSPLSPTPRPSSNVQTFQILLAAHQAHPHLRHTLPLTAPSLLDSSLSLPSLT
jgi:hypothetical protein